MKKLLLSAIATIILGLAYSQDPSADSVSIKYYLSHARNYQKDIRPSFAAFIKVNAKKYYLERVMINTRAGEIIPEVVYNKRAKRREYFLKTWYAGVGTNFKAYVTGTKATHTETVMVYAQDLDEKVKDGKWRLVKAVKL